MTSLSKVLSHAMFQNEHLGKFDRPQHVHAYKFMSYYCLQDHVYQTTLTNLLEKQLRERERQHHTKMAMEVGDASAAERRILVTVDEGEESMYALSWCLDNVVSKGNKRDTIILLHAMPFHSVYVPMDDSGYLFSDEIIEKVDKYGQELADAVVKRAKDVCEGHQNVKVEVKVKKGDARDVICEAVEKHKCDLLVMGSHGYGVIKRALLGSVSNHCAQNAKCPVLIVRTPKHGFHVAK